MQRFTRLGAALALALGLVAGPSGTLPAPAHGGPIDVELGTDGGGGVSATLTWARDGHPVEESAVVVVRAVSADGERPGPVTLASASEGIGWYVSESTLLGEGHWTITARVKEPRKATVKTEVDVVPPADAEESGAEASGSGEPGSGEPGSAGDGADAGGADAGEAAARAGGPSSSGGIPAWTWWALAALVVAGAVTAVVRRGRTT